MSDQKRPYRKQLRAEQEQQTRLRITESAVALHGTLGPSRTSMSAIADHAGVRRSTLYRHFADEAAVFGACAAHWASANPLPDLRHWAAIDEPEDRLGTALVELYGFYARNEQLLSNLLRDEQTVAVVGQLFGGFHEYLDGARQPLMRGRRARGAARERQVAAIGHALAFATWQSLVREQQLTDEQAVDLMSRLVAAATAR